MHHWKFGPFVFVCCIVSLAECTIVIILHCCSFFLVATIHFLCTSESLWILGLSRPSHEARVDLRRIFVVDVCHR